MNYEVKMVRQMIADGVIPQEVAAKYFPELAESEDERIRKELIAFLKENLETGRADETWSMSGLERWIDWLEKQGEKKQELLTKEKALKNSPFVEQKPADKIEPKFKVGDFIQKKDDNSIRYSIINRTDDTYRALRGLSETIAIWFSEQDQWELVNLVEQNPAWSEEDETTKNNISHIIRQYDKISKRKNQPCYYVGDCLLWMQNIKGRVLPQPKQEWSEEDKKIISDAEGWLDTLCDYLKDSSSECIPNVRVIISKLKSLRPQMQWKAVDKEIYVKEPALAQRKDKSEPNHGYVICYDHTLTPDVYERYIMISDIYNQSHWKPSDEQMKAIEFMVRSFGESGTLSPYGETMAYTTSLLNDLKKL